MEAEKEAEETSFFFLTGGENSATSVVFRLLDSPTHCLDSSKLATPSKFWLRGVLVNGDGTAENPTTRYGNVITTVIRNFIFSLLLLLLGSLVKFAPLASAIIEGPTE